MEELDRRILAFAGAHRFVLEEQIRALLGAERDLVAERLGWLEGEKLMRTERLGPRELAFVRVTASGLRSIGSRLPAPGLDAGDYRHAIGVAWLWVAGWNGYFGEAERVLSVREMRGLDRAAQDLGEGGGRFAVPVVGERMYPDVTMAFGWGRGVLHLVAWPYRRLDFDAVFAGYRASPDVADVVMMLVDDTEVGHAVRIAADRQGVSEKVRIQGVRGQGTALLRDAPSTD